MLTKWVLDELEMNESIFGIPKELFFQPDARFETTMFGQKLATPIGVAAGPHTQMAQNIIVAWLCGARFIELKTVQILDELDVSKPCIDAEDEGYNCEWSQELRLDQSFDEYLKAWVLLHVLKDKFGWSGELATIFNMSVGYNLEGILSDKVQSFLANMRDSSGPKKQLLAEIVDLYPRAKELDIPDCLSDNITLSTMHGCPPDEIERIGSYLIERGYHTTIKFNPTLLGAGLLRTILNEDLGFPVVVPDLAFEHDPTFEAVKKIITNLRAEAAEKGVQFGVKTTNTLESMNIRHVLPENEQMNYMSGRALHPITTNVAKMIAQEFGGTVPISFAGGIDAFNIDRVLACGIYPVTVCTDILKPGGYTLLTQYLEQLGLAMDKVDATTLIGYVTKTTLSSEEGFKVARHRVEESLGKPSVMQESGVAIPKEEQELWIRHSGLYNLEQYADAVRKDKRYHKEFFEGQGLKTDRSLGLFDCIHAPCVSTCPTNQNIPSYMHWTAEGNYDKALEVILQDNPLPNTLGHVCDHVCTTRCVRTHYDKPLAIREIKRFATEAGHEPELKPRADRSTKVAIVGAGPSGLSAAYFLILDGFKVTVFEARSSAGGLVFGEGSAIPSFRLPQEVSQKDLDRLIELGVEFRFNTSIGEDKTLQDLREDGYRHIFIAVGAQKGKMMGLENENAFGVYDCLKFLADVKTGGKVQMGNRVAIIGGGNSAVDAARVAWRLAKTAEVTVVYRRTQREMPADREEVEALLTEGIQVLELVNPVRVDVDESGQLKGLTCVKMELGELDKSGRPRPTPIAGSEHFMPFNSVVVAIGQDPVLNTILKGEQVELGLGGWVKVDPETLQTSVQGLYAGGDVVRGPSSIVKAVGDGKKVARSIIWAETAQKPKTIHEVRTSRADMIARKARKVPRATVFEHSEGLVVLRDFSPTTTTISQAEAQAEASRCFICSDLCDLCETDCPNRANISYHVTPREYLIPTLVVKDGQLKIEATTPYRITQPFQILNVVDFCNECGNCATFCPTSGAPYKDKPKFFLKEKDFRSHEVRYPSKRYLWNKGVDISRLIALDSEGEHQLSINMGDGTVSYIHPHYSLDYNPKTFEVTNLSWRGSLELSGPKESQVFETKSLTEMYILARGILDSLPFFPSAE